tara:strand:- start:271 stop:1233 length:963 start_codon:yes stop_codon:yes gene_type:complete
MKRINKILYLLLKSIMNPKKMFLVLNKRLFSMPNLNSLDGIKNTLLKEKYYFFWINLAKKNNKLKKHFFENQKEQGQIYFDFNDKKNFELNFSNSLAKNGLVCITNILPKDENIKIQKDFFDLRNYTDQNKDLSNWLIKPTKTISKTKVRVYSKKDLSNYTSLNRISDIISKEITGKSLKSEAEFFLDSCIKLPEEKVLGDNILHVDRFVPNFKIIYSPFDIEIDDAPFTYLPKSHKINKHHKDMIFSRHYQNIEKSTYNEIKNQTIQMTIKKNTLVVFLANGFHARTPFLGLKNRMLVFLQFNKSFNLISLFNYKKFNS